jgi:hypothetical protein
VTNPSKSKTRSVAAIGDGFVIPAKAGIQCRSVGASKSKTRSVVAIGDGFVIPAKAGIQRVQSHEKWIPAYAGMTEWS